MGSEEIPSEWGKVLFTLVFLGMAGFSNWVALAYVHDFVGTEPLPDFVFSLIPAQKWAQQVGDLMVTVCIAFLVLLLVFHAKRVIMLRRTCFILGVLNVLRTISITSTQLPSAYVNNGYRCAPQLSASNRTLDLYWERVWAQVSRFGLQNLNSKMLCGDLLFSGHTLMMSVCALTIAHYLPKQLRWLRHVPFLTALIGVICMVISRTHYTIDVLFAYWLSVGVFTMYHSYCEISTHSERNSSILMQQLWIFQLVAWLEENVLPGKLENRLYIPFFGGDSNALRCCCGVTTAQVATVPPQSEQHGRSSASNHSNYSSSTRTAMTRREQM